MIEQAMRSALLLLAGMLLSAGALGQTVTLTQVDDYTVTLAAEYFGGDAREVTFTGNSQAAVRLNFADAPGGGTGTLDAENTRSITFTLNGATFAASATPNHLSFHLDGTAAGNIARTVTDGGARGDRSVTYLLEVVTTFTPAGGNDFLYFSLPNLDVSPVVLNPNAVPSAQVRGVTVTAALGSDGRSASNPFPDRVLGSGIPGAGAALATVVNAQADGTVIQLRPSFTASLGTATQYVADVALASRKAIAAGAGSRVVTMSDGATKTRGLQVGDLSITLSAPGTGETLIRTLRTGNEANGGTPAISGTTLNASLGGTADVTVSGPFQDGDMVFLGDDQTADTAKAFTGSGGTRTANVQIGTFANHPVVYVPGGVADLRPGVFSASLALNFNDARNASGPVPAPAGGRSSGQIQFQGIETQAYAYGISRANDAEITSFIRMTCASATPPATGCDIFINCAGEDGTRYFGELTDAETVSQGATGVYTSGDIANALGGGWSTGGGRCDLLSNGDLEVQHMIRTSGNALHNNSIVIGRTQSDNVGILRSRGPHPVGSVTLSLGPAATPGTVRLLSTGRIYGPIDVIRALAAQLRGSTGLQPGTRFYAPPGAMSGGRQPMVHEPGCAYLERDLTVTPVNCFHLDDANPDAILADSRVLMSGDILYPNRAVYRPSTSTLLQPAASASATVLSG